MSWQIKQAASPEEVAAVIAALTAVTSAQFDEPELNRPTQRWARSFHPMTAWAPTSGWTGCWTDSGRTR